MEDQPNADSPAPPAHTSQAPRTRLAALHGYNAVDCLIGFIEEQNRVHGMEDRQTTTPVRMNHHLSNQEPDPMRWVDSWTDLSEASRERLKVEILTAYSYMFGIPLERYERLHLFWNRVFDTIAAEFLSAGLLSIDVLGGVAQVMVSDTAVAADLQEGFDKDTTCACAVGHYCIREAWIKELRRVLHPRVCFWQARLIQRGTCSSSRAERLERPEALVQQRLQLLKEYLEATGATEHAIYGCAGPGTHSCHKPEFYKYKNGTLPSSSSMALSLERFLRNKIPPPTKKNP